MKKSRLFGVLLSLALMLGLMPGMNLTAYAATSHGITINSAQHGSVSASVNGSAATSAEEGATVTLTASPENGYRLKSISGTYADYPNETIKYGATGGTHFNLTSSKTSNNQWCLWGDGSITITSKDNKTIDRLEITISKKTAQFKKSYLHTQSGEGTLSVTGNTIFVTSINKTGLSIYSSAPGYNYGCYANSVKIYYKDGTSTCTLNISATDDKNVRKFTMPVGIQGNVSITAEFEEVPKYSVTITPGSNMTKTTDSGVASQTDLSGAMKDVVYTANDGYYFPTDYSVTAVNGISVTRNSYTQITVSGTPIADAAISLTAPTAKTDQTAPTELTATKASGSTAADGKISGVTATMEYQIDGATTWTAVGENQTEITGLTAGTYKVRYAGTADKNASPATSVEVGVKEDQTAPTGLSATKASSSTATDGKISGVTSAMEYQIDGATTWTAVGENKTEITGLTTGTYKVRYAGTADKNASPVSTVEVGVKVAPTVTAPTAKTLTYNGQAQELVIAGSTEDGTLYYAVTTENTAPADNLYTTSIPSKTDAGTYYVWYKVQGDDNHNDTTAEKLEVTINAPVFGTPDFTLPASIRTIGDNAFEGAAMTIVDARSCTAIGAEAFKNCANLTQVRIPGNCTIGEGAFDGCGTVFIFAPSESAAESYCRISTNCVFIAEDHS